MCKVPPDTLRAPAIAVGFSARALADAIAAHLAPPLVVDHFADHDCCQTATAVVRLAQWGGKFPHSAAFLSELSQAGAHARSQVLLAGGTENWPELVELLQQHFTLLGPNVEQLRELRSPQRWQRWAEQSHVAFPEMRLPHALAAHDRAAGDWLNKPLRGAGGYAIRRSARPPVRSPNHSCHMAQAADKQAADRQLDGESELPNAYWQRHIEGRSVGVCCVLHRDGSVELLGATESLAAAQWPGPSEFIYRGSLGPIDLPLHHRQRIEKLCQVIQRHTGMLGWLQLDFIEDLAGELWLLELNPRWTAGMELLFLAGINAVAYHCRAWQAETDARETIPQKIPFGNATPSISPIAVSRAARGEVSFGKAIVYAPCELVLTQQSLDALHGLPGDHFADLPSRLLIADGQTTHVVATGQPVLTVRARGSHETLIGNLAELRQTALTALTGGH